MTDPSSSHIYLRDTPKGVEEVSSQPGSRPENQDINSSKSLRVSCSSHSSHSVRQRILKANCVPALSSGITMYWGETICVQSSENPSLSTPLLLSPLLPFSSPTALSFSRVFRQIHYSSSLPRQHSSSVMVTVWFQLKGLRLSSFSTIF